MISVVQWFAAAVMLLAALPASAFVRETTTPRHPESGLCVWWRSRQVTYRVNASSATATPCQSAAAAESTTAAAMSAWGGATRAGEAAACTDFRFLQGPPTTQTAIGSDGVNLVVFRTRQCRDVAANDTCRQTPGACAAKFNCWDYDQLTIALTTVSFDRDTGEILDADMELNGWDGTNATPGSYFTCAGPAAPTCNNPPHGQTDCNWVDVGAVVTHEAGHMLGLDHVCDNGFVAPYNACPAGAPVMAPTVGNVALRVLAADDVAGVCTVYPAGGATLTCNAGGASEGKSGGGCSTTGGSSIAALLLGAVAVWQRRRRAL